jgi:hypothetical protein
MYTYWKPHVSCDEIRNLDHMHGGSKLNVLLYTSISCLPLDVFYVM